MAIQNLPDFTLENHLSIVLLRPNSPEASKWLRENAPDDSPFFGPAMAIEPRYVSIVVEATQANGWEVR